MKIFDWLALTTQQQLDCLRRPLTAYSDDIKRSVEKIINQVKLDGDQALYAFTQQFDGVALNDLVMDSEAIAAAAQQVDSQTADAIQLAIDRISRYHQHCLPQDKIVNNDWVTCQRLSRPIERVGLYVPGGSAPLISTLMMIAIPALIAGCPLRVLCTPPNRDGTIDSRLLFAAKLCGINRVFKLGGAQAIAAMAYGTQTVPKVDKLFGPGNSWVMAAKQIVAQDPLGASIDLPAGPSEVLVIADKQADVTFVAADLLSQAEHGSDSQVILITDDNNVAKAVKLEVSQQLAALSRRDIAAQSLQHSRIIVVDQIEQAFAISNRYAPEHLILQLQQARDYLPYVKAAGAVFLGSWTPEALGDYTTGSNHVLPTSGYAKSCSGLSVEDYLLTLSVQESSDEGFHQLAQATMVLAEIEGLDAHRQAVALRAKKLMARSLS